MSMVIVSRPILGIPINGKEYLLDDSGNCYRFKSTEEAKACFEHYGYTKEQIEALTFETVDMDTKDVLNVVEDSLGKYADGFWTENDAWDEINNILWEYFRKNQKERREVE